MACSFFDSLSLLGTSLADFFYNKDIVAASPKKIVLYTNAHFNGEDGSRKIKKSGMRKRNHGTEYGIQQQ